jgi:hypothetical protein
MVIVVREHVPQCYTWEDGAVIGRIIHNLFSLGEQATVSFRGVDNVPSSFVNGAFVTLLDDFDFEFIKRHLSVIESNRSINQMIRRRLQFEAERRRPEAQPRPVFTRT